VNVNHGGTFSLIKATGTVGDNDEQGRLIRRGKTEKATGVPAAFV
jgi:hypothetical protein